MSISFLTDKTLHNHPGTVPSSALVWPADRQKSNQIQQTKGSAQPLAPFVLPTTQPNKSIVEARTTPKQVSNVRVVSRSSGSVKTLTVQFNHPTDPYFQGASVYLKRSGQEPTQVASGAQSPLTFTVPKSAAPHAIHVISFGPWGETNILQSPSVHVKLG